MNWTEQVETMTEVWVQAQKKMWDNWYDLSQAAPSDPPFFTDAVKQWQNLTTQNLDAWMANAEPTAKDIAKRLLVSQKAFVKFLEFSADAWKKIATKIASREDWQDVITEYSEQLRREMLQFPDKIFNISQNVGELWQLYLEQVQKSAQPWMQSWPQADGYFGQTAGNGSAFVEVIKHYQDAYEHTFGHLLESPTLGYTRELNEKVLKGFDAWQDLHQINLEYQLLLVDAWINAFEQFQRHLVSRAENGEIITSLEQLANAWFDTADEAFIDVFRSEQYIRVQGQLLNATLTYRLYQREIVELFLKINDLPTRTEVDEAHRNIYQQGKEIKSLKKTIASLSGSNDQRGALQNQLQQAQQTIQALRKEIDQLKSALVDVTAQAEQVGTLRKELDSLKQAVGKASTPKQSTRKKQQPANITATTASKEDA